MLPDLSPNFPPYVDFEPAVPVFCVTPDTTGLIHRFFDTSPFSPSGRYLALTRLPFEDRLPQPGEVAEVVLVDLQTGTRNVVAETRGWDTQLGAQVQWGADDHALFFNDLDPATWLPFGVRLNPTTGEQKKLQGTVYMVSPDGKWAASPCLRRTGATQAGYGVIVPPEAAPRNRGAAADDGLILTNTETGHSRLLVSLARIFEEAFPDAQKDAYAAGDFYGFHVKWNRQGTRLMFVVRWLPRNPAAPRSSRRSNVITMTPGGEDIRIAIPDSVWGKGGHHPDWHPDGDHVTMNLNIAGEGLRFVQVRYDGHTLHALHETLPGSGHPTVHPDCAHILTDVYAHEPLAFADGTTPLRWLNRRTGSETHLLRIRTRPGFNGPRNELRVDPHPAWDSRFTHVAFNACPDGRRQVFVADLTSCISV